MMDREKILKNKIKDDPPTRETLEGTTRLLEYYKNIHGFMAGHAARASEILYEGIKNSNLRILSFTANIVATGLRGLLSQLVKKGFFDLIITTCGTVDHDIAKSVGPGYYAGDFLYDDYMLEKMDIHRLGNVLVPKENYGPIIEEFVKRLFEKKENSQRIPGYELLWEAGSLIKDNNSILRSAWDKKVPIVIPGFYDGSFGTNVYIYSRLKRITIDLSEDQKLLDDLFFESQKKTTMALIIGGGISKHHTIWWSQFAGGLDYAVYVTTAVEYDGSLSGAHPREAVSWEKIKPSAKHIVVYGDATILLPIVTAKILL